MNPEAILAGIGAVLTTAMGVSLTLRELRSRERKAARAELEQLTSDLYGVDEAYIAQRHYSFVLRQLVADNGQLPPSPPVYVKQMVKKAKPKPAEPKLAGPKP